MAGDLVERDALNRLMTEVRPRLHRYCTRMVGSVFDGEDIVQEALAKAAEALPRAGASPSRKGGCSPSRTMPRLTPCVAERGKLKCR